MLIINEMLRRRMIFAFELSGRVNQSVQQNIVYTIGVIVTANFNPV